MYMGMYILTIIAVKEILVVRKYLGIVEVPFEVLILQRLHNYLHLPRKLSISKLNTRDVTSHVFFKRI